MNRLKEFFRNPREPERQDDFYEVHSRWDTFHVSKATAMEIDRAIDQVPMPVWIVFRDLTGARHRIELAGVYRISESTVAQRAASRAFERARNLEEKEDRKSWEDD
ncbi:MAG TPA: hypothetical protein VIP11_02210 [Gemmatimonadaceae bacterium]